MNADETEVFEFLKQFPGLYVSVTEVSKRVGHRRRYLEDRNWARPILRRMELDGLLESNPSGEYRIKDLAEAAPRFLSALETPGVNLGDTAIICIQEVQSETESAVQKADTAAAAA